MTRREAHICQDYFQWLCELVRADGEDSYILLCKRLHETPFIPKVDRDENRAMDGMQLRERYESRNGCFRYLEKLGPCSIFEMMIALAERMDYELSSCDDDEVKLDIYFWEMIRNLELDGFTDEKYCAYTDDYFIGECLNRFVHRSYMRNGKYGLFPLRCPKGDQRQVEIWLQMNAYIMENYDF